MTTIKAGDKVQLISGSNQMVVASVGQTLAYVLYWNPSTHAIMREKIDVAALQIMK